MILERYIYFSDLEKIRQGVSDKISICFQYASSFVVAYVLAFTFGPKLAAVMCAILPLMVFCGVGYVRVSPAVSCHS